MNPPITGIVSSVRLSTSFPKIENEATELVADRLRRLNGDGEGAFGVHIWPAVGGVDVQPVTPSTPGSSSNNVILMFGATENVIKSGMGKITLGA